MNSQDSNLEAAVETPNAKSIVSSVLDFPEDAIVGSIGLYARAMSAGTEVPVEFNFVAGLTFFGAMCGAKLSITAKLIAEPRLYAALLGESGDSHKSTPITKGTRFFNELSAELSHPIIPGFVSADGVGSAEGLAKILNTNPNVLLSYDELKALIEKSKVQASVLLPMVTSLFEKTSYENHTKEKSIIVPNAHLSILGGCTLDTYGSMWTRDALDIGLINRLFIVQADRRVRIAWPDEGAGAGMLEEARKQIKGQIIRVAAGLMLDITPDAKAAWEEWYQNLRTSIHTKRLDAIGLRLMMILAATTDKDVIDRETVERIIRILNYELAVRLTTDPIDADTAVARMEIAIRKQLEVRGALTDRDLKQHTNAHRKGLWVFEQALKNLIKAREVVVQGGRKYQFVREA